MLVFTDIPDPAGVPRACAARSRPFCARHREAVPSTRRRGDRRRWRTASQIEPVPVHKDRRANALLASSLSSHPYINGWKKSLHFRPHSATNDPVVLVKSHERRNGQENHVRSQQSDGNASYRRKHIVKRRL